MSSEPATCDQDAAPPLTFLDTNTLLIPPATQKASDGHDKLLSPSGRQQPGTESLLGKPAPSVRYRDRSTLTAN
jgi:hypothetical protein